MSKIKIKSGGMGFNTEVLVDGVPVSGVTQIIIEPITQGEQFINAQIFFENVELDLDLRSGE